VSPLIRTPILILENMIRDVIHAQGARIRAQGAPGYAHKEQAHKRGDRLTEVFTF
jgi:hypothetical protein